ncbi:MAG: phage holin family protein [Gallionella sp.]
MTESGGLMESLKRMAGTLLVILQTRLELLSIEVEAERLNIKLMLLYGSITLLFFGLATILLTTFVVVVFWDSYRFQVLAGFIGLYFVVGALAWNALLRVTNRKSKLFSGSLAALADDRQQIAPLP